MRKALSALTALLAIMIGGFVFAPAASAASYGCSGNLIDTYNVKTGSTKYGVVYLYYSSANGGTNCAVTVDTRWGSGTTKQMAIYLDRCSAGSTPGQSCYADQFSDDSGYYTTYAGPATVTGTANRCVRLNGVIWNPAHTTVANLVVLATHCG